MVEHRPVAPRVVGSSPIAHPKIVWSLLNRPRDPSDHTLYECGVHPFGDYWRHGFFSQALLKRNSFRPGRRSHELLSRR